MKKTFSILAIATICAITIIGNNACVDSTEKKDSLKVVAEEKPLNISIFLDLSDRIIRDLTPSQMERDNAIVGYVIDYFIQQTQGAKILQSKNNIKVFFYPTPKMSEIATLAADLSVDMSEMPKSVARRETLERMKKQFQDNLSAIYNKTLETGKYPGCDIWDFFSSKKVDSQCMREGYRNILIILTDGYLYDENHKVVRGDSTSFISASTLANPNSALIVKRQGLENIEVRILEVNPIDINHRDRLVSVLEEWLKDMGVKEDNITVSETSLPTNTQTIIKSFLYE